MISIFFIKLKFSILLFFHSWLIKKEEEEEEDDDEMEIEEKLGLIIN